MKHHVHGQSRLGQGALVPHTMNTTNPMKHHVRSQTHLAKMVLPFQCGRGVSPDNLFVLGMQNQQSLRQACDQ